MQHSLFPEEQIEIITYNGNAILYPAFFTAIESDNYFHKLFHETAWKQEPIKIFGKEVMQPRLTAWYGEEDKSYTYSGITMQPQLWTKTLLAIKQKIEPVAGVTFTSALLNLYRNGKDSMGWHRDNEKELGINPVIGSVSFGASRIFQFRNYKSKADKKTVQLSSGSLLLMKGETNDVWEHQVPKTNEPVSERINITFRVIQ